MRGMIMTLVMLSVVACGGKPSPSSDDHLPSGFNFGCSELSSLIPLDEEDLPTISDAIQFWYNGLHEGYDGPVNLDLEHRRAYVEEWSIRGEAVISRLHPVIIDTVQARDERDPDSKRRLGLVVQLLDRWKSNYPETLEDNARAVLSQALDGEAWEPGVALSMLGVLRDASKKYPGRVHYTGMDERWSGYLTGSQEASFRAWLQASQIISEIRHLELAFNDLRSNASPAIYEGLANELEGHIRQLEDLDEDAAEVSSAEWGGTVEDASRRQVDMSRRAMSSARDRLGL